MNNFPSSASSQQQQSLYSFAALAAPRQPAAPMSNFVTVKVQRGSEIRRLVVNINEASYSSLLRSLVDLYPDLGNGAVSLTWIDQDGDHISVDTDLELTEALLDAQRRNLSAARFRIQSSASDNDAWDRSSSAMIRESVAASPAPSIARDTPAPSAPFPVQPSQPFQPLQPIQIAQPIQPAVQPFQPLQTTQSAQASLLQPSPFIPLIPTPVSQAPVSPTPVSQTLFSQVSAPGSLSPFAASAPSAPLYPNIQQLSLNDSNSMVDGTAPPAVPPKEVPTQQQQPEQPEQPAPSAAASTPVREQTPLSFFNPSPTRPHEPVFPGGAPASASQENSAHEERARSRRDEDPAPVVHTNVTCDLCGQSPILGARYRCVECPDYDHCAQCETVHTIDAGLNLNSPGVQQGHLASHVMVKIPRPGAVDATVLRVPESRPPHGFHHPYFPRPPFGGRHPFFYHC